MKKTIEVDELPEGFIYVTDTHVVVGTKKEKGDES